MDQPFAANFRPETAQAIAIVARVLAVASNASGVSEVTAKEGRDIVTTTDLHIEDAVRAFLTEQTGLPVVGEERGGVAPSADTAYWLVDPLCGTRNFASRLPLYCVNIALIEHGEVRVAVVGDPHSGAILVGEHGRGAWALSAQANGPLLASDASQLVVVEDGKASGRRRAFAARLAAGVIEADRWDFRSFGSTVAFAYLAAGQIAAYAVAWVTSLHAAAGSLLAAEAGATVTDVSGRPWTLASDSLLVAANAELHAELLAISHQAAR